MEQRDDRLIDSCNEAAAEEEKEVPSAAAVKRSSSTTAAQDADHQEISEVEKHKLCLMRAFVEKKDPSSKEVDGRTMRRFLRARELDVKKASAMLLKYMEWRRGFVPEGRVSATEVPIDLAQNKVFAQGVDRQGRPLAVLFGARHFHNKRGLDDFKRYAVFVLDRLCDRMGEGQEKFVVIGDLQGWGYANCDVRAYLGALSILQDYYPERLEKCLILHAPSIFMTIWKIVWPFIDNNTRKKMVFVENKRLKETLLEDIEESQLPEVYGGKMPLVPIQD